MSRKGNGASNTAGTGERAKIKMQNAEWRGAGCGWLGIQAGDSLQESQSISEKLT